LRQQQASAMNRKSFADLLGDRDLGRFDCQQDENR
jgi:hypothetical protein